MTEPGPPPHESSFALPPGTRMHEFVLRHVLGVGGFGIVYLAWDELLEREVAIKEYLPAAISGRSDTLHVTLRTQADEALFSLGLRSFVNEARLLARFDHPSLIKVYRFWEGHGTAYMAMPVLRGMNLRDLRRRQPNGFDEPWLRRLLGEVLGALQVLHAEAVYHRDIAPDNIVIEPDGRPVLLDFGAARRVIGDRSQTLTAILKPAYAPIEQYAESAQLKQGPWTDFYALGATLCYLMLGRPPEPATARVMAGAGAPVFEGGVAGVSTALLQVVEWMLAPKPDDRPASVVALRQVLEQAAPCPYRPQAALARRPDATGPTLADAGAAAHPAVADAGAAAAATTFPSTVRHVPTSLGTAGPVGDAAAAGGGRADGGRAVAHGGQAPVRPGPAPAAATVPDQAAHRPRRLPGAFAAAAAVVLGGVLAWSGGQRASPAGREADGAADAAAVAASASAWAPALPVVASAVAPAGASAGGPTAGVSRVDAQAVAPAHNPTRPEAAYPATARPGAEAGGAPGPASPVTSGGPGRGSGAAIGAGAVSAAGRVGAGAATPPAADKVGTAGAGRAPGTPAAQAAQAATATPVPAPAGGALAVPGAAPPADAAPGRADTPATSGPPASPPRPPAAASAPTRPVAPAPSASAAMAAKDEGPNARCAPRAWPLNLACMEDMCLRSRFRGHPDCLAWRNQSRPRAEP